MNALSRSVILACSAAALAALSACSSKAPGRDLAAIESVHERTPKVTLSDPAASPQAQTLYQNLHRVGQDAVLFGHQDSLAYGVEWMSEPGRSDIKAVTGAYPAVYGWDIGHLERGDDANLDGVNFQAMQGYIRESFARGGVNAISWHMTSLVSGESSWTREPTVHLLLPGEPHHARLKAALDTFAEFVRELTYPDQGEDKLIPLIFRPWHEHNGDWFWWGKAYTSESDYVALWRFTADYLRSEKGLHNLIFAFSPDRSRLDLGNFNRSYFWGYPGDDYVDIIGLDNYWDMGLTYNKAPREQQQQDLVASLTGIAKIADQRNKFAALTEGGRENIPEPDFWTARLLNALTANEYTREVVYVQVWRNANREKEERDHFFAPYPGQTSAEDFITFYQHPFVLFEDELPDLYGKEN